MEELSIKIVRDESGEFYNKPKAILYNFLYI